MEEGWPVGEAGGADAEDCPCGCGGACGCSEPAELPAEAELEATDDCGCGGECGCAELDETLEFEEGAESLDDEAPAEEDEDPAIDPGESAGLQEDAGAAPSAGLPAAAWQQLRGQLQEDLVRLWGRPSRECGAVVGSGGRFQEDFYGDGSDGDLEVVEGFPYTLSWDMYFDNLVIGAGARLWTYGFRVYVKGKLTIGSGGRLHCDGDDATGWQGASPGAPSRTFYNLANRWQMPAGGKGGWGGQPAGPGTVTETPAAGGRGQARVRGFGPARLLGGCGGGGGTVGVGGQPSAKAIGPGRTEATSNDATNDGSSVELYGGGGGGAGWSAYAHEIDNAGTISADGGAGAAARSAAPAAGRRRRARAR